MTKDVSIWLETTEHMEHGLLFHEEKDFKVGMNYVAILAASHPVDLLAFILMSNHVHFVLMGTKADAKAYMNEFKRRYSKYLQRKYGSGKLLKNNRIDEKEIRLEDDALERAIAYTLMNCVAARICLHSTQYPWGSGNVYFNATPPRGTRIDNLSVRERIKILHSKSELPGEWLIGNDGYILPSCYVKTVFVENLFRTPQRMDYYLRNSSKAKKRLETGLNALPSFKDQTIIKVIPELCWALFEKTRPEDLSDEQKTELLRQLRFRFSSNVHQLARITGLSYDAAAKMLDAH